MYISLLGFHYVGPHYVVIVVGCCKFVIVVVGYLDWPLIAYCTVSRRFTRWDELVNCYQSSALCFGPLFQSYATIVLVTNSKKKKKTFYHSKITSLFQGPKTSCFLFLFLLSFKFNRCQRGMFGFRETTFMHQLIPGISDQFLTVLSKAKHIVGYVYACIFFTSIPWWFMVLL